MNGKTQHGSHEDGSLLEDKAMHWFALIAKPQHERIVAKQLAAKSLQAYVPFYCSQRRWSDRVKAIELPLFPRYVFCRFGFDERLKILGIPSVISIVSFGGTPCPVSEKEIDAVKRVVGCGLPVMPWPFLRVGESVRIGKGPLSGLEGILVKEKTACRVVVNVEMLQRAVAVEVEREWLELIAGARNAFRTASAPQDWPTQPNSD